MNIDNLEGNDEDKELNIILNPSSNTIESTNDNLTSPMDDGPHGLFSPKQHNLGANLNPNMPSISPMQQLGSPKYGPSPEPNLGRMKSKSKSRSKSGQKIKEVSEVEMTNFIQNSMVVNVHESVSAVAPSEHSETDSDDNGHYRKTKKLFSLICAYLLFLEYTM